MENNCQVPKRRGRPAGSKNKRTRVAVTNPSVTIEGDGMVTGMGMHMGLHLKVLEVPAGRDVISAVYDYANRHQLGGLGVITTHGIVHYQPNITMNSDYKLLFLIGKFYESLSSIRPPSPFSTRHIASCVNGEGNMYVGTIEGKLIAEANVCLVVSFFNGTESVKLPLPPPPPPPRALPASQLFFNLNGGMHTATAGLPSGGGRSRIATAGLPGLSSGAARSRTATAGLLEFSSGAARSRIATAGLPELSSGAGRFRMATDGLLEFSSGGGRSRITTAGLPELSSGAARSRIATAGLSELSSGAGRFRTATDGLLEFSSGAGRSRIATAGLPELSSGAARSRTATAGLLEFSSDAARSRIATAGLPELSSGAGWFRTATAGLSAFSSGAGSSRAAYGVPTALPPSPLISCLMNNNFSSTLGSKDTGRSIVRGNLG